MLALAALGLTLAGCRSDDLALRAEDGLAIERPGEMESVELPVTVRWRAEGVRPRADLTGPGPFFAVFVDRAPVPAGTGLRTLMDDDCREDPDCPDLAWFAERDIYITGEPSITLRRLPQVGSGTRTGADNAHRVTVVKIGGDGVRIDEAASTVEFEVVE